MKKQIFFLILSVIFLTSFPYQTSSGVEAAKTIGASPFPGYQITNCAKMLASAKAVCENSRHSCEYYVSDDYRELVKSGVRSAQEALDAIRDDCIERAFNYCINSIEWIETSGACLNRPSP